MSVRLLFRLAMGATMACLLPIASAGTTPPSVDTVALGSKAWLLRMHDAATYGNYTGTLVSTADGVVSSLRVAHYCEDRQQYEHVEPLDGRARHIFRHNDTVHTVWPNDRVVFVERREGASLMPSIMRLKPDERLFERYEFQVESADRVAGHDTQVLMLRPRDQLRYAQRLWAERKTGLLLRADVLSADGRVLESLAFSDVTVNVRPQPESVLKPMKKLVGYRVVHPPIVPADLVSEGWTWKPVAGFEKISCTKRGADSASASGPEEASGFLQAVFSDGLTHVSVFIEPFVEGRHVAGSTVIGATRTLTQRHDQWWITLMGDVPAATLIAFGKSLERRR